MSSESFCTEKDVHIIVWAVENYLIRVSNLKFLFTFKIVVGVGQRGHDVLVVERAHNLAVLIVMHESFSLV
jgi:hypothetical protein